MGMRNINNTVMAEIHAIAFPTNIPNLFDALMTHITVNFMKPCYRKNKEVAMLMKKGVPTFAAKLKVSAFFTLEPYSNYRTFPTA